MAIRPMQAPDLEQVRGLAEQLGYPSGLEALAARFEACAAFPGQGLFVAESEGRVAGWVHVQRRPSLLTESSAEIGALVVDEARRGQGLGRALMAAAEAWALGQGCSGVQLRSRVEREAAHRFYEKIGYGRLKTSYTFKRKLG